MTAAPARPPSHIHLEGSHISRLPDGRIRVLLPPDSDIHVPMGAFVSLCMDEEGPGASVYGSVQSVASDGREIITCPAFQSTPGSAPLHVSHDTPGEPRGFLLIAGQGTYALGPA